MKYTFFIIAFLFGLNVNAQKTKKVIKKSDYPSYKETIHVLKSDQSVKHGEYKKEIRGNLLKKGQFTNNQRTGVWEYYDLNGNLMHKVNAENYELIFDANPDNDFDKDKYSRPLIILGGFNPFFQQIGNDLRYPAQARRKGTEGKVMVKLVIDEEGKLDNVTVIEGPGYGLDEEAVRVIKLVDFEALPAIDTNGKSTTSEIIFPVSFKLG